MKKSTKSKNVVFAKKKSTKSKNDVFAKKNAQLLEETLADFYRDEEGPSMECLMCGELRVTRDPDTLKVITYCLEASEIWEGRIR